VPRVGYTVGFKDFDALTEWQYRSRGFVNLYFLPWSESFVYFCAVA